MNDDQFMYGLLVGLAIGAAYCIFMRLMFSWNLIASARSGGAVFLRGQSFYLVTGQAYLDRGLWVKNPADRTKLPDVDHTWAGHTRTCPHGHTGNWSDDCPDCRH